MSFLDEGTFVGKGAVKDALKDPEFKALKGDEKAKALQTLKMGGSITTEKKGKDVDGDGDVDSDDYLAARDAAIKKAKSMKEGVTKDLEIKAMEASSLEEFLDDVYQDYPQHKGNSDIADFLKKYYLNAGGPLDEISEGKLANALGGVALLAGLLLMNKINSNDPVVQRLQAAYEQAEGNKAAQDSIKDLISKRLIFLDSGEFDDTTPMKENAIASFIRGGEYGGPVSDFFDDLTDLDTDNDDELEDNELNLDSPSKKKKFKELDFLEKLSKGKVKENEYKAVLKRLEKIDPKPTDIIKAIKDAYVAGQRTNEAKTIELPADTTFTLDLKHLMKKHMAEGKSKEDTIAFTKKLMAKLHDKGEVKVDGTKIVFKEGKKKSGYMGYTELAEADEALIQKIVKSLENPNIGTIQDLERRLNNSKKKKEEFEDARDSKGISNYRYYEKIIPKYEELIDFAKHTVKMIKGGADARHHVEELSDKAEKIFPPREYQFGSPLVPVWLDFAKFDKSRERLRTRASDGRIRDLERERNREAGKLGENDTQVDGTKVTFKKNKTNEASIMGVPLESFADYYTALELAKNVGVPVVAFSALLAIMGVKKATEFLKKGKEAVMAWYEQNKLNEQEDAQLALPEPDAQDFLGDDGMDYEGGMAKSQMLKMKKYAVALCDMIDDESQLESWVQAKLTKASDYMSSVYHYLDYQKTKMNEAVGDVIPDGVWQKLDIEWIMDEPDINRVDYQEGPLYGTTEDGRAFESYGNWTPFEDEYRPLKGEEVVEVPSPLP